MKNHFAILPFEYVGANFNPTPHSQARLAIGGKTRNFYIKMREGVIYFKEPSRGQIYAIPELFEESLTRDSIALLSVWTREVRAGKFGALVTKRDYFAGLPVRAQIVAILKPDGTGWMREHFDQEWFVLPEAKKITTIEVWDEKAVEAALRERFSHIQNQLLNRTLDPSIREMDVPRWEMLSGEALEAVIIAAARLFIEPRTYHQSPDSRLIKIKSQSAFSKGDIEGFWLRNARRQASFEKIWQVLEPQILFLGIKWSEGAEESSQYERKRSEKVFKAGIERWGENWRGNWAPQRASFPIQIPDIGQQSAHEKLEAGIIIRDILREKINTVEMESLLRDA